MQLIQAPAPGARALIRDEEWIIQNADQCNLGGWQLSCIGVSETVRNRHALFLTELEDITLIDPAKTELIYDESPTFTASRLFIEARLRQSALQNDAVVIGQQAVMDALPFQLQPAQRVLEQLRPRLLIADTVGLGKTLEAGILTTELMRRGKARRILVVTTKSMMRQFQQEFWNRFTIPLTRLDSAGIQRIRRDIPANHNPFNYYDRTIISVDTLKRDSEYRHYLEKAWWDLIIIDEAHNVSYKGSRTQSNRLAELLSQRSDALILLTATPHNGKKDSFASLMRMLDPTVLPAGADYTRDDVEHLFIRRFKKDVREQMKQDFPEREVFRLATEASPAENLAFDALAELKLNSEGSGARDGAMLFRTVLEKALFSSPAACLQTLKERIRKLENKDPQHPDLDGLRDLQGLVQAIGPQQFSKFQHLIEQLRSGQHWRWDSRDPSDRLVLFTERVETLKFLQQELPKALGLKGEAVAILHGQLPDQEIQQTVEDFGKTHSPLRLLIASDVASEGLNLHYQAHRLIHFDISWSLMVFQQRNGRVDRYGQTRAPKIAYLLTEPRHERIRGDLRYLEILIDKDEQAAKNIGDPSAFMGLYDEELEELEVAKAIEGNATLEAFQELLAGDDVDPFEALWASASAAEAPAVYAAQTQSAQTQELTSLFGNSYQYLRDALRLLAEQSPRDYPPVKYDDANKTLSLQPSRDLAQLLKRDLASEMWPEDNTFALSADKTVVELAIRQARDTNAWPQLHYLWALHPIAQWLDYKLMALFGRQRAPLLRVAQGLNAGEAIVLVLAQVPNRRGQAVLAEWMGVQLNAAGQLQGVLSLEDALQRTGLAGNLGSGANIRANDGNAPDARALQAALPAVIQAAQQHIKPIKQAFDADCRARLDRELSKLKTLQDKHTAQLELDFAKGIEQVNAAKRKQKESDTAELFNNYQQWIRDTLQLDDRAQFTVVAALMA
ncbi:TPA: DEAD/DEAH box helicase family protein [Pseudomonas aeruginosa]|uniref:DEAD/DEAH box helicase n=1 Tax=Pseudomonas aeruginosa TaxID=287 RepID=UPI000F843B77|nr:DEAD/DEAH box helicase [Pseudomonas aeruginosa]MBG6310080.1 DEAD/DEAH box helicase family protein [Pseudomonas aeruginosa]MDP5646570.1 helicase-related protein [Pseudomonas aeruginosa]RTW51819.1 DEAD/DEAH box helicase [Pseudomonas aeruginosa]HCF7393618.1 DEAD/DEAH box helicase family protein [Pseudomonas aeruginosa]HCF7399558.1 DEAD/DEAH box helicase family protein [Pseudomonas aeruginosa]